MRAPTLVTLLSLFLAAAAPPAQASDAPRVPLAFRTEHFLHRGVDQAQWLDRLGVHEPLEVTVGLPLRHQPELDALRQQLHDPASPRYHQWLTPEAFTLAFSPTEADYAKVLAWATGHNLQVIATAPNRLLLNLRGSAADIEHAFHLRMNHYLHASGRTFRSPDRAPSLDLDVPIATVNGLNNLVRPVSHLRHSASGQGSATPPNGSGPGGLYLGKDFRAAYAVGVPPAINGFGQGIALVEFSNYYTRDPRNYWKDAGLAPPVIKDLFAGAGPANYDGQDEVSLDIELAGALANGATIFVYMGSDGNTVLNRVATDNLCKTVGISWSWVDDAMSSQSAIDPTQDAIFKQMDTQGIACFAASGDTGPWSAEQWAQTPDAPFMDPINPSDVPYVTSVGGTNLATQGPGGLWSGETPWLSSGGGPTPRYPLPTYQAPGIHWDLLAGASTLQRNCPDVAAVADNIYLDSANGVTAQAVAGTSCSAPLWAAFAALANQTAIADGRPVLGSFNPLLYRLGTSTSFEASYHAVTVPPVSTPAPWGIKAATGWGSPVGQLTIDALQAPAIPMPFVTLAPRNAAIPKGTQRWFTAKVTGTGNSAVLWSASEGTIDACGLFTAPGAAGTCTVTATSVADPRQFDQVTVQVVDSKS